jgi:hypothetical protein
MLDAPSAAIIVGNTMYITNSNSNPPMVYPAGYVSTVVLK